uniref:Uncharacterized protein n=1 Tax=Oryza glumipatula TaxID=40148 RepID=A0A0D9ZYA1_9ORYZ
MTLSCRQGSRRHRDSSPSMRDVTRFHLFVRRRRLRRPPQESRTAAVDRDEEGQAIIEIVARVGTPAEKGTGHSKLVRHYDSEASWNNSPSGGKVQDAAAFAKIEQLGFPSTAALHISGGGKFGDMLIEEELVVHDVVVGVGLSGSSGGGEAAEARLGLVVVVNNGDGGVVV